MAKDHGPQIKDDEQYEALRKQGASKEKAARIASTGRPQAGQKGRQIAGLRGLEQGRPLSAREGGRHRGPLRDGQGSADRRVPQSLARRS